MPITIIAMVILLAFGVFLFWYFRNSASVNEIVEEITHERDFSHKPTDDLLEDVDKALDKLEDRKDENQESIEQIKRDEKQIQNYMKNNIKE